MSEPFDEDATPARPVALSQPESAQKYRGRDGTSPIVRLVERDLEPSDLELAARLRASAADPYLINARLIRAIEADRESTDSQLESQLGAAIRKHDGEVAAMREEIRELKRDVSTAKWIVRGIFAAIGIFGLWAVDRTLNRTERDGEITIKLQVLEKTVEWLRDRGPGWPLAGGHTDPHDKQ